MYIYQSTEDPPDVIAVEVSNIAMHCSMISLSPLICPP
jgi:hypothetical protein